MAGPIAVLTDLWPSASEPFSGSFVRGQVDALADEFRQLVLAPRLLAPGLHARVWGRNVQGWQRGWEEPGGSGRLLRYPMLRVPRGGEAEARAVGARLALLRAGERPALVHGHFLFEVGVGAVRLARSLGVPSVVTVHGTDGRWLVAGGTQERYRARMLAAARSVDRLVVVEQGLADAIAALGVPGERIVVEPMGVDEQRFQPRPRAVARARLGVDPELPLVVFVGRATVEKGTAVLDEALGLLDPGVQGVAVGPAEQTFRRLRTTGAVRPDEVSLWLTAADVACLPSFAEGMPVSVGEALASGRPVVASAVGGIPSQIDDGRTGLLVPPGDARALADALAAALARTWPEQELRSASRRFWWSTVRPRLVSLYRELLEP